MEHLLRAEYPGLSRDLASIAKDAVSVRGLAHGMTVRELVVDQLLLLSTAEAESVPIPDAVKREVEDLWRLCRTIFHVHASAEEAVRLADRLYVRMDELLKVRREAMPTQDEAEAPEQSIPAPKASEDLSDTYRPMDNWDYRGAMDPNLVRDRTDSTAEDRAASGQGDSEGALGWPATPVARQEPARRDRSRCRRKYWWLGDARPVWWMRCWRWRVRGANRKRKRLGDEGGAVSRMGCRHSGLSHELVSCAGAGSGRRRLRVCRRDVGGSARTGPAVEAVF